MKYKYKISIITAIVLLVFVANVGVVQAAGCDTAWKLGCRLIPTNCTDNDINTECGVLDMVVTAVHVAQWILAVIGAVAFAYFVYGGFILLTAAGNTSHVDHGRRILLGTVIGLFIVLGAFQLVSWVGTLFGGGFAPTNYNQFLSADKNQCVNAGDGDTCNINGENVFACIKGVCSSQNLCEYWKGRNNPYGLTPQHECVNPNEKNCDDTKVIKSNMCRGGANIVCCDPI